MAEKKRDEYSIQETARRFEAALRGAFSTPPKPMKDIPRRRKAKRKPKGKASA